MDRGGLARPAGPVACNRASADFMVSSPLMAASYQRRMPDYAGHNNRMALASQLCARCDAATSSWGPSAPAICRTARDCALPDCTTG